MNGTQIWSKEYAHDLEADKIMDIQDQINDDVFALLSGHYGFIISDTMRLVEGEMKKNLQSFDAILWYNLTQLTHSEADCSTCRDAIEKVLQNEPINVMCLIILGDLYLFCYSFGYATINDPVNEAMKLIKKALRLAPFSQFGNLILGWANIYLGKKQEAIEALEYSAQLAPPSPSFKGSLGFGFACVGEYNRSLVLLQQALNLNPYCPWWYYMAFFFYYYQGEKYEEALAFAQKMDASEDVYLVPLLTAAAKGQLNRIPDAEAEVKILNERFPEIIANLEVYLGSFVLDTTLVEEIIIGAKKAGVKTA
jgi:predicted Zn-dependent protease